VSVAKDVRVAVADRTAPFRAAETPGERFANVATHGVGMLLAAASWAAMQEGALAARNPGAGLSVGVFGATLFAVYMASTLYHAAAAPRVRARLRRLDRAAIYLLIAGTYTPFCVLGIGGRGGGTLLALEWILAAIGIALQFRGPGRVRGASLVLYLAMGWAALPFIRPVAAALGELCAAWLAIGGIAYTSGLVFFAVRRPYTHAIWHLFVLAGSAAHVYAVLAFLLPRC
jgi:hemolysin III